MDKLNELIASLKATDESLDALLAHDELSDAQRAEHATLTATRTKTQAAIRREQDRLARAEQTAELEAEAAEAAKRKAAADERAKRATTAKPGDNRLTTADEPTSAGPVATSSAPRLPAQPRRFSGSLKHFSGIVDGKTADERAHRFGLFGLAMLALQFPARYGLQPGFRAAQKFFEETWLPSEKAINLSNDSNGTNFLIPDEFSADMIDLRERYGVARRALRREVMTSDRKTIPRRQGGLTAYFTAEGAAGTESTKIWNQVGLTAKDVMVLSRYSAQVNADAVINFGDDLAGEISYAFAYLEDGCAFNGDGTSTYGGIRGIRNRLVNDGTAGVATQGTSNTWAAIVMADFLSVVGKLPQYADRPGTAWYCHRAFYANVMERLLLAQGGSTTTEAGNGDRRPRPMFLGYPVEFVQVMPSATAVATLHAILGDLSLGAAFGDRQMDSIAFSDQASVGGQSLWERNELGIRGTERFDINVHDVGDASTAGPIVGLKTGA